MDYKETHISFLYDDLVKEYGNETGETALCLNVQKICLSM